MWGGGGGGGGGFENSRTYCCMDWTDSNTCRCGSNYFRDTVPLPDYLETEFFVLFLYCEKVDHHHEGGSDCDTFSGSQYLAGTWNLCGSVYCKGTPNHIYIEREHRTTVQACPGSIETFNPKFFRP